MRTETFDLEGVAYYAEGRKCGKAGCRCQEGDLHGPYWYKRDQVDGKVTYLGKTLPDQVAQARQNLWTFEPAIKTTGLRLAAQAEALRRLQTRQHLTAEDRAAIRDLGFGACLVARPDLAIAQDAQKGD